MREPIDRRPRRPAAGRTLSPGQAWRLREYRRRLEYIAESYSFWSALYDHYPSHNESLRMLDRALHSPRRKRHEQIRLHPDTEIAISMLAAMMTTGSLKQSDRRPTQREIEAAADELLRRLKPIRGRPIDRVLRHHVQGLMVLCEWATGKAVTASPTTRSVYQPQMTSPGAKAIEMAFRRIDPAVTTTTLMNIVRCTRAIRGLDGKGFEDFFPGYQGEPCPGIVERRGPEVRILGLAHPIYCS